MRTCLNTMRLLTDLVNDTAVSITLILNLMAQAGLTKELHDKI